MLIQKERSDEGLCQNENGPVWSKATRYRDWHRRLTGAVAGARPWHQCRSVGVACAGLCFPHVWGPSGRHQKRGIVPLWSSGGWGWWGPSGHHWNRVTGFISGSRWGLRCENVLRESRHKLPLLFHKSGGDLGNALRHQLLYCRRDERDVLCCRARGSVGLFGCGWGWGVVDPVAQPGGGSPCTGRALPRGAGLLLCSTAAGAAAFAYGVDLNHYLKLRQERHK